MLGIQLIIWSHLKLAMIITKYLALIFNFSTIPSIFNGPDLVLFENYHYLLVHFYIIMNEYVL